MARSKAEDIPTDAMFNPEKYGYEECSHCKGFGSSLKDPEGVDTCTVCGGPGLVKKEVKDLTVGEVSELLGFLKIVGGV